MDAEKSITLRSGGQLTVKAEFDPFALSAEDRTFVYGLCDALADYERGISLLVSPASTPPRTYVPRPVDVPLTVIEPRYGE
jgi:hypothetical protein